MRLADRAALAVASTIAVLGGAPAGHAAEAGPATTAVAVIERTAARALAPGVRHLQLRMGPEQVANVARIDPTADVAIRSVLANDRIAGDGARAERTSSMCARTDCIVAVNGDFFRDQVPVGAVVTAGRLLRSPSGKHHQLSFDAKARPSADHLTWKGRLVPTDLDAVRISGLNIARGKDRIVLYTRAWANSTASNRYGVEMVLEPVAPERPMTLLGQTTIVRLVKLRKGGDTAIPPGAAVLSGHGKGAAALTALWQRIARREAGREALLRVESNIPAVESIGGTPILLRDGRIWFQNRNDAFTRGRHPRTIVGWNRKGTTWLVTIDGRQPGHSMGVTLAEAARFMLELGATDAINLDGGGSSTFVVGGDVVNRPSDTVVRNGAVSTILSVAGATDTVVGHVERPVANALVVVPAKASREPLAPSRLALDVPAETVPLASPPAESDPGSNPAASLPALVGTVPAPRATSGRDALLTLAVLLCVAGARANLWARRRSGARGP